MIRCFANPGSDELAFLQERRTCKRVLISGLIPSTCTNRINQFIERLQGVEFRTLAWRATTEYNLGKCKGGGANLPKSINTLHLHMVDLELINP